MKNKALIFNIRELISRDELPAALEQLRNLLDNSPKLDEAILQSGRFQYIRRQIRLGVVSHAEATLTQNQIRFGLLDLLNEIEEDGKTLLPVELAENLITDKNQWVKSLSQELLSQGVSVGNRPSDVFQHFGWMIEVFLQKMGTSAGQERSLRGLSFMTEAFQNSLRYLCYIQVAQIFQLENKPQNGTLAEFLQLREKQYLDFDYLNLLLLSTDFLKKEGSFVPEIHDFVAELLDTQSDLYRTVLFLDGHRRRLLENTIPEDEHLPTLLDEYLTGLIFWLRQISFLAKYRLVSVKDINLSYRLGTSKKFVHLYGELHGIYSTADSSVEEYNTKSIEGVFTYNQSVLLFKGSNVATCLDNIHDPTTYLSLSPLLIDQSVFAEKPTQTPEIFYFIGSGTSTRQYDFAQYKNELAFGDRDHIPSNKFVQVKTQNNQQPKLDELFKQLELVFKPFKTTRVGVTQTHPDTKTTQNK
ncbi:MAG: hypothetical protein H7246_22100 [Phycisphaerae bacterium]|nr:hypothetical protein [Saprospiraceae bacterium]